MGIAAQIWGVIHPVANVVVEMCEGTKSTEKLTWVRVLQKSQMIVPRQCSLMNAFLKLNP